MMMRKYTKDSIERPWKPSLVRKGILGYHHRQGLLTTILSLGSAEGVRLGKLEFYFR